MDAVLEHKCINNYWIHVELVYLVMCSSGIELLGTL